MTHTDLCSSFNRPMGYGGAENTNIIYIGIAVDTNADACIGIMHSQVDRSVTLFNGSLATQRGRQRRCSAPEDQATPSHVGRRAADTKSGTH